MKKGVFFFLGIVIVFGLFQSCDSKDIDGLLDKCPNCGAGKPIDTKYYIML